MVTNLGNVDHSFFARSKLNESAKFLDAYDSSIKDLSCLEICCDGLDHLLGFIHSVLVNTAQDVARILEAVDRPNCKACIDFGAMEVAGDTIDGYFEVLGDKIVHTHFVDVGGGTTHLAWGDGERDMRADLEALMRHGYTGYVSAETCDGRYYQDPSKATTQVIEMYRRVTAEMEAE